METKIINMKVPKYDWINLYTIWSSLKRLTKRTIGNMAKKEKFPNLKKFYFEIDKE